MDSSAATPKATPPRRTLRNLIRFVIKGDSLEIAKIIRRRSINLLKFLRRIVIGFYYDRPAVKKRRQKKQLKNLLENVYLLRPDKVGAGKSVAIIARDGDTYPKSSAFIRLISPLTQEVLQGKVHLRLYPQNTVSMEPGTGLCIVQRNAFDDPTDAKQLVDNLRQLDIPLIVDTDDAFSRIDPSHPEHSIHTPTLDAFRHIVSQADQIWVSTTHLKQIIGGRKTYVIPNTLDDRVWKNTGKKTIKSGPIKIVYMGTVSHDADLEMIMPALQKTADKFPSSFQLTVIGVSSELPDAPWLRRVYQKNSIYPKFTEWFLHQGPFDIGLSPLVDSEFNRAKSDIKCLDYLAAGILPVVSDIEPYQTKELSKHIIKVKNDTASWENALAKIVKDPDGFRAESIARIAGGQKYVWQKRSTHQSAQQIYKKLKLLFPDL